MSCFKQVDLYINLNIRTALLKNPIEGVHLELQRYILKYIPALEGVLLTYRSVRFTDASGAIQPWTVPTVRVSVVCRAVIFAPFVGAVLRARVKRLGSDYVALTAWDTWNVTVPKSRFGECNKSAFVIGQLVQFAVEKINVVSDMLSLTGSLLEANTGIVHGAPIVSEVSTADAATERRIDVSAAPESPSKSKKRKHDESELSHGADSSPKRKKTKH